MSRNFSGQLHVRISTKLHKEISHEAFEKGVSISGICAQALVVRNVLQNIDPWKGIEKAWAEGKPVDLENIEKDVSEAIRAVRKK
jgi:hypothetical protein